MVVWPKLHYTAKGIFNTGSAESSLFFFICPCRLSQMSTQLMHSNGNMVHALNKAILRISHFCVLFTHIGFHAKKYAVRFRRRPKAEVCSQGI